MSSLSPNVPPHTQILIAQHHRLLRLDSPLGADVLLPQRLIATDRLSQGYQYTIDLIATRADIALEQLIAQAVTLWIRQEGCDYLPIHGYVHTAKRLGSDGEIAFCQLCFAPWLHFLNFRKDARIWQDKSAEEILVEVFNRHPQARGNYRFDLERAALSRSYCTQYETDWHFVQRLMEEEGWFAYHEQMADGSGHVLIITDNSFSLPALPQQSINFHGASVRDELDRILHWSTRRTLSPKTWSGRTDDYRSPRNVKASEERVRDELGNLPRQMEIYEYTGAYSYPDQEQGDHQADLRVEQWESSMQRYTAVSGVRQLSSGRWFRLDGHPLHQNETAGDRQFMIIALDWFIENNLPLSQQALDFPGSLSAALADFKAAIGRATKSGDADNQHTGHCFNRLEVQRRKQPFRSASAHSKPLLLPQTAVVVGPGGEEVYTDHLNRIKVKFRWDRVNPGDESASCWLRVSYPNAGEYWGAINVPRIGQEVIVSFLNGDPDRPVVTGRLYPDSKYPLKALEAEGRQRTPASIRETYRNDINKVMRKYLINSPVRMAHFLGEAAVECMYLLMMAEGSVSFPRKPTHESFHPEDAGFYMPKLKTDYLYYLSGRLGNIEEHDGPKFRGRGIKQLSGRENYGKYWVYRGWLSPTSFAGDWWNPSRPEKAPKVNDPHKLSINTHNAIDSGGWYWTAGARDNKFKTINLIIRNQIIDETTVEAVATAINGINRNTKKPNHLDERMEETLCAKNIVMDNTR